MSEQRTFWALAPLLVLGTACAATPGDGNLTTESIAIPTPFTGIVARQGFLVEVVSGPGVAPTVEVTVDGNLQSAVEISLVRDVLVIDSDDIAPTAQPVVRATTEGLASVSSNGSGTTVLVSGVTILEPGEVFSAGASEGGAVEVTGSCADLVAIATGPSIVRASGLACERGDLEVLGGSLLEVQVSESARVRGSGPSTVRITGSPATVEQNVDEEVTVVID